MTAFKIDISDRPALDAFNGLLRAANDPAPALKAIGEALTDMTKQSFAASRSPFGPPWAPNSPATYGRLVAGMGKSSFGKGGRLNARGAARVASKRPLIGETGALSTTIGYNVANSVLEIGSPMEYAAMQQFGGTKGMFPNLWGDIPARPFLPVTADGGLAPAAREVVVDAIRDFLAGAARG